MQDKPVIRIQEFVTANVIILRKIYCFPKRNDIEALLVLALTEGFEESDDFYLDDFILFFFSYCSEHYVLRNGNLIEKKNVVVAEYETMEVDIRDISEEQILEDVGTLTLSSVDVERGMVSLVDDAVKDNLRQSMKILLGDRWHILAKKNRVEIVRRNLRNISQDSYVVVVPQGVMCYYIIIFGMHFLAHGDDFFLLKHKDFIDYDFTVFEVVVNWEEKASVTMIGIVDTLCFDGEDVRRDVYQVRQKKAASMMSGTYLVGTMVYVPECRHISGEWHYNEHSIMTRSRMMIVNAGKYGLVKYFWTPKIQIVDVYIESDRDHSILSLFPSDGNKTKRLQIAIVKDDRTGKKNRCIMRAYMHGTQLLACGLSRQMQTTDVEVFKSYLLACDTSDQVMYRDFVKLKLTFCQSWGIPNMLVPMGEILDVEITREINNNISSLLAEMVFSNKVYNRGKKKKR